MLIELNHYLVILIIVCDIINIIIIYNSFQLLKIKLSDEFINNGLFNYELIN